MIKGECQIEAQGESKWKKEGESTVSGRECVQKRGRETKKQRKGRCNIWKERKGKKAGDSNGWASKGQCNEWVVWVRWREGEDRVTMVAVVWVVVVGCCEKREMKISGQGVWMCFGDTKPARTLRAQLNSQKEKKRRVACNYTWMRNERMNQKERGMKEWGEVRAKRVGVTVDSGQWYN